MNFIRFPYLVQSVSHDIIFVSIASQDIFGLRERVPSQPIALAVARRRISLLLLARALRPVAFGDVFFEVAFRQFAREGVAQEPILSAFVGQDRALVIDLGPSGEDESHFDLLSTCSMKLFRGSARTSQ